MLAKYFTTPSNRSFVADFALKVFLPSLTAAAATALLLLYIINGIFNEANALDQQYANRAARAAQQSLLDSIANTVADNARWDEAARHVYAPTLDRNWLLETWGTGTSLGLYDVAVIVDNRDQTLAAFAGGKFIDQTAQQLLGDGLGSLLGTLPADGTRFAAASGYLRSGNKLFAVAAGSIVAASQPTRLPEGRPNRLIMGRELTPEIMSDLAKTFVLDDLHLVAAEGSTAKGLQVTSPGGDILGHLTWTNRRPGDIVRTKFRDIVTAALTTFLFVIGIMVYMSWRGFRDAHVSKANAVSASLQDELTGLANRRAMLNHLSASLAKEQPSASAMTVVYADLDGFKEINDAYGHEVGDQVLKAAAAGFAFMAPGGSLVSRLGGDEFAIIIEGEDSSQRARTLAEHMFAFFQEPMVFGGRIAPMAVSIGIVDVVNDGADSKEILRRADVAMYAAKANGRNRSFIYDPSLDSKRDANRTIAAELREAIESRSLTVVYQPIVDARTRRMMGVEALVRWPKNSPRHVSPEVFIKVAEEFGLIEDLGHFVLVEACRQAAQWNDITMSVNVSPIQFMNPGFADIVEQTLRDSKLEPTRLEIEVTEGFIIDNADRATSIINRLHDMRVTVALDDFGTGYSSIGHLRRFKFDKLKLDRSMVSDILRKPSALRLVQGTIAMADALSMRVTAEGIEDENQVSVLRLAGCSLFQGYLFSKPVDAAEITAFLDQSRKVATN